MDAVGAFEREGWSHGRAAPYHHGLGAITAARGAEVVAVDFSEEMLALAASLHPSVSFQHADAGALPFADGAFAAVVANFLMPHVSDFPAVTAELPPGPPFFQYATDDEFTALLAGLSDGGYELACAVKLGAATRN